MYGNGTWVPMERDLNELVCLKEGFVGKFTDRLRETENGDNKELYQHYRTSDIITDIKMARLRWKMHMQKMDNGEIIKNSNGKKYMGWWK